MLYAIVAVILLILDQALKLWVTNNIILDTGYMKLIPGFVHLTNLHNNGAAFGFLQNFRWFFVVLCAVFCAVIIYLMLKNIIFGKLSRWSAVVVMAGALGNCIDRVINGYVVDMFEFEFFSFPIFNVADIFITVGGVLFCLCILFEKEPSEEKSAAASVRSAKRADSSPSAAKTAAPRKSAEDNIIPMPTQKSPVQSAKKPAPKPQPRPRPQEAEPAPRNATPAAPQPKPSNVAPAAPTPRPQPKPHPKPQPPVSDDEFDLESILNEFLD